MNASGAIIPATTAARARPLRRATRGPSAAASAVSAGIGRMKTVCSTIRPSASSRTTSDSSSGTPPTRPVARSTRVRSSPRSSTYVRPSITAKTSANRSRSWSLPRNAKRSVIGEWTTASGVMHAITASRSCASIAARKDAVGASGASVDMRRL